MNKLFIIFFIALYAFGANIYLENCEKKSLSFSEIPKKYYVTVFQKGPFDKNPHHYTGITLKNFQKIIGKTNKITFIAYDEYKVTFDKNEINKPYILFVFLKDSKPIPLSQRGPAEIIYTKKDNKKNYFFKSIFLIKKAVCEK